MADIFDKLLAHLDEDDRSNAELETLSGVPSETIRDIRARRVPSPGILTIRRLGRVYRLGSKPKRKPNNGSTRTARA